MRIYHRFKDDAYKKWEEITDLYFFEENTIHSFNSEWEENKYEYKFVIQNGDNVEMELAIKIA